MLFRKVAPSLILLGILSTSSPAQVMTEQPYLLGPEDTIEVAVFGNPDVSCGTSTRACTVTIRPDGMISLPLVGEVTAAGLTPDQLRQQLTQLFATYIRSPRVTVIVHEFRRLHVTVLGQVTKPGVYELAQGAAVLDALAAAGGLTVDAGLGEARLLHGQDPPVVIDLERLLLRGDLVSNILLSSGDALVIPDDPTARVYVLGEVEKPGVFPLRGGVTALQALAQAGGPTRRALLNRAHIVRRATRPPQPTAVVPLVTVTVAKQSAPVELIPVDLAKVLEEGDVARDIVLRRGDVLFIPNNPLALDNLAILLGIAYNAAFVLR